VGRHGARGAASRTLTRGEVAALNFQEQPQIVEVCPGAQFTEMTNLLTGERAGIGACVTIILPGYGYALYRLDSAS
jgi:hypothetical protein